MKLLKSLLLIIGFAFINFNSVQAQSWAELNNKATEYFNSGNDSIAISYAEMAIMQAEKEFGKKHINYAISCGNLAFLYKSSGDYGKAEPLYLQSVKIIKKTLGETHPDYATCLNGLANLYCEMGSYVKAEPLCLQVLEIRKKSLGENHLDYASSLNNLALIYDEMGNYTKAESLYIEALEITKKVLGEADPSFAISLNNLASLYEDMGNYAKAEPLYIEALEIRKKTLGENHPDYATSLNNLAGLYNKKGDYSKAEPMYIEALEIIKKTLGKTHPKYANSLSGLAGLYDEIGNYAKAVPLCLEVLEIRKKTLGENHPDYATSLNNLAGLYEKMGNYVKAEAIYIQALEITKKALGENHPDNATSLNNLALLYSNMGNYEKAKPLYIKAIEIRKKTLGETHPSYAQSLNNLAALYSYMRDYSKAEPLYKQAIEIRKKTLGANHPAYATSLNNLAGLYEEMGNYTKAEPFYIKALEVSFQNIEQQFSFLSEKEKELYLKTLSDRFEHLNSVGLKGKESNPAIAVEVYNNLLKTKGLLLKSSTAMRNAVLNSNDGKLIATYDKWNSLKKQIANIYNLPIEKRNDDLPKLENEANDLEKELTKSSSSFIDFNSPLNINWKDIQTQLKPNEAAIEFANFKYNKDSVLYCALIIKKDSEFPVMVQLFEDKQLTGLLANLKENNSNAIRSAYGSKQFTETKLYDVIWKPLEQYLKGIEIINYSPSGLLHKVSFAALSNGDDHYLIDDYKLNMLTSTAMIAKTTQSVFDKNTVVSLFGGINYSIKDTTNKPFNYLGGTLSETDQLNNTLKKQGIKINYIKATDATKQEFKSIVSNSNIIHIATHGFFFPEPKKIITETDENKSNTDIVSRSASRTVELNYIRNDNPLMRSGLLLAGANDYWNGITGDIDSNGVLTALEVVNIDLRKNKLVVLSACETGLGDIKDGEGVYGLQRAFKMAGTENIIMSLWKVPDNETSEFMNFFYELLFTEHNINQAFTETQNLMRKKYDPFYWAAFVLVR